MAAPVNQIRPSITDRAEAGEYRDLILDGLQRFQLRHDFVAVPSLARDPPSASRRSVCQAQAPEISTEPDRQLRSIGECGAIEIEEPIKDWKPHTYGRATKHASQERAAIEG